MSVSNDLSPVAQWARINYLDEGVPGVENGDTDVELIASEAQVLLEIVESSVGNGILIKLVHEIHAEDDWHNVPIKLAEQSPLFFRVLGVGTELVGFDIGIVVLWDFLDVLNMVDTDLVDGVGAALSQLETTGRGVDGIGGRRSNTVIVEVRHDEMNVKSIDVLLEC